MKVPFWISPKLAGKPPIKYPSSIRTLLKSGKMIEPGAGPRTLDSVLSYIKTASPRKKKDRSPRMQLFERDANHIAYDEAVTNVIICVSQRDFPLNIHQRTLVLLSLKGIDLKNVHWVITDADQLGDYQVFPENHGPLSKTNIKWWEAQFVNELATYLGHFQKEKLKPQLANEFSNSDLFSTSSNKIEDAFERVKTFKVSPKNVHLYSTELPWTLLPLIRSMKYDPFVKSNTYVIGQTNSGKTSLVKNMLQLFSKDLQATSTAEMGMGSFADFRNIKIAPHPFSSKFNVYGVQGIKIIDTPGFVRHNGGIWSHVNKYGAHLLKITKDQELPLKSVNVTPRVFPGTQQAATDFTGVSIGGLVFLKPWVVLPKGYDSATDNTEDAFAMNLKISRNMPGRVSKMTVKSIHDHMWNKDHNKILAQLQWKRHILSTDEIEMVLDNIGSFTVYASFLSDKVPSGVRVYWEVSIPERVRALSKVWIDGDTVQLETPETVSSSFSAIIGEIYRSTTGSS